MYLPLDVRCATVGSWRSLSNVAFGCKQTWYSLAKRDGFDLMITGELPHKVFIPYILVRARISLRNQVKVFRVKESLFVPAIWRFAPSFFIALIHAFKPDPQKFLVR